jgi:oligopeptide/dipeptide ABC transporter ATP-binding protein
MEPMVEVKHLKTYFPAGGGMLHAVDDVSMSIEAGRTMGVVGESGCGKTTLGRTILHLEQPSGGRIIFDGNDITHIKKKQLQQLREQMQIIFQDPFASLNPRYTIEETIREPLQLSGKYSSAQAERETKRLMELVGVDRRLLGSYPHELDGGRRQRVVIARALAMNPKFIVCDEPVSALDVSIQAQVLNLLLELQEQLKLTYILITHDLSVVHYISDDISVMYLGQLVETGASDKVFEHPLHPYTQALFSAIPSTDIHNRQRRILLKGEISSPVNPRPGCRFASRCNYATEECQKPQNLEEIESGHFVACCRVREVNL